MKEINIIEILVVNQENFVVEESIVGTPIVISANDFYFALPREFYEAVTYSPQERTEAEKLNARNNIGAVGKEEGKGLSQNDFTNAYKNNVDANTAARHIHNNLEVLEQIKQSDIHQISTNKSDISTISSKIPSQANENNQLADKDFVNSSINSLTADYITSDSAGNAFATKVDLDRGPYYNKGQIATLSKNDYALVNSDETHNGAAVRYVYDGAVWAFQYIVNPTPFTAEQLAAINSGITADKVSKIPDTYVKSSSVDNKTLILKDNNNNETRFTRGNDLDNRTIRENSLGQIETVGLTDGTDVISFEDIYNAISIVRRTD